MNEQEFFRSFENSLMPSPTQSLPTTYSDKAAKSYILAGQDPKKGNVDRVVNARLGTDPRSAILLNAVHVLNAGKDTKERATGPQQEKRVNIRGMIVAGEEGAFSLLIEVLKLQLKELLLIESAIETDCLISDCGLDSMAG
jgi:hypothetical protein